MKCEQNHFGSFFVASRRAVIVSKPKFLANSSSIFNSSGCRCFFISTLNMASLPRTDSSGYPSGKITDTDFENSQVISSGDIAKGGAVYSLGGNLNITDVDFKRSSEFETFPGSQLASFGGSLFIQEDEERIERGGDRGVDHNVVNTNTTNSSADFGGAYYFQESTIAVGLNIHGTSADKGAAIYIGENASEGSDYEVKIINCTLVDNSVTDENGGGAIWIDEATGEGVSIINTIIWDNYDICTPPNVCTSLNGIGFNESVGMYLQLIHSSIQDDPESRGCEHPSKTSHLGSVLCCPEDARRGATSPLGPDG